LTAARVEKRVRKQAPVLWSDCTGRRRDSGMVWKSGVALMAMAGLAVSCAAQAGAATGQGAKAPSQPEWVARS